MRDVGCEGALLVRVRWTHSVLLLGCTKGRLCTALRVYLSLSLILILSLSLSLSLLSSPLLEGGGRVQRDERKSPDKRGGGTDTRSMQSQLAAEAMGKQQEMRGSATNDRDGREDDNTGRSGGGGGGLDDTFGSDLELMEDLIRGDDDQSRGAASRSATKGRESGKLQRRGRSSGMEDFERSDGDRGDDDDRGGTMDTMDNLDILEDDIVQEVAKDNLRTATVGVGRGGGSMLEELP